MHAWLGITLFVVERGNEYPIQVNSQIRDQDEQKHMVLIYIFLPPGAVWLRPL